MAKKKTYYPKKKTKNTRAKRSGSKISKSQLKKFIASIQGGQDVEDTKDTTPKRRGGL